MLNWPKKHPWLTSMFAVGIMLTLLFFGSFLVDVVRKICEKGEYTGAKECASYHLGPWTVIWISKFIDTHNGFVTALGTIAVALFTLTLWRTSDRQAVLTREAIDDARRSSEQKLRAYVFIDAYEVRNFGTDRPLEGWMMLKNSGSTPAYSLERSAKLMYAAYPASSFPEIDWPGAKGYLAPGGEVYFGPICLPRALTLEEAAAIKAGTHAIYLFGKIRYIDAFMCQRNISFRSFYRASLGAENGAVLPTQQDTEGNNSD